MHRPSLVRMPAVTRSAAINGGSVDSFFAVCPNQTHRRKALKTPKGIEELGGVTVNFFLELLNADALRAGDYFSKDASQDMRCAS